MDLLNRYLQAVGQYLPAKGKEDTLAELRANLLAQMEGREEELGRPLNNSEVAAVLAEHGRPVLVAARYLPQQYLIGPGLFPIYWITLKKSLPLVALLYVASQAAVMIGKGGDDNYSIGAAIGHFPSVLLIFWAVMTLGFCIFEYGQGRLFPRIQVSDKWDPMELPELTHADKQPSLVGGIADLIVSLLAIAFLLAIPHQPYLLLGPGAPYLRGLPIGITPEWHIFYWQIVALMVAAIPLKVMTLFPGMARWRKGLNLATKALGILGLVVLVQARSYFVPSASLGSMSADSLANINWSINVGFKVVLAISVINFLWDIWKMAADSRAPRMGSVMV